MLVAVATPPGEKKRLIIGLEADNIEKLVNDQPILKDLALLDGTADELAEWELAILGPEDTVRFQAHLGLAGL